MSKFTASWLAVAEDLLSAELGVDVSLLPGAVIGPETQSLALVVDLAGVWEGTFAAQIDSEAMSRLLAAVRSAKAPDAGASTDAEIPDGDSTAPGMAEQWERLFGRACIAAAADLGAKSGAACEVAMISPGEPPTGVAGMGYQLHAAGMIAAMMLFDEVAQAAIEPPRPAANPSSFEAPPGMFTPALPESTTAELRGVELLLDVELDASLRFGSREMTLSDLLALGPGDVIQLDRALTDPVDLLVGDKIVARGEVVLVNGNFGLQVLEVAEPRKSLESIRCLF